MNHVGDGGLGFVRRSGLRLEVVHLSAQRLHLSGVGVEGLARAGRDRGNLTRHPSLHTVPLAFQGHDGRVVGSEHRRVVGEFGLHRGELLLQVGDRSACQHGRRIARAAPSRRRDLGEVCCGLGPGRL